MEDLGGEINSDDSEGTVSPSREFESRLHQESNLIMLELQDSPVTTRRRFNEVQATIRLAAPSPSSVGWAD